jgi:hypothetical protein
MYFKYTQVFWVVWCSAEIRYSLSIHLKLELLDHFRTDIIRMRNVVLDPKIVIPTGVLML